MKKFQTLYVICDGCYGLSNQINRLHNRETIINNCVRLKQSASYVRDCEVNKGNKRQACALAQRTSLCARYCFVVRTTAMPKTSKRKNQLMDARASKHVKMVEPEVAFDLAEETEAIHSYAQEWVQALHRDDKMSLSLLLHDILVRQLNFQFTEASRVIGENIRVR